VRKSTNKPPPSDQCHGKLADSWSACGKLPSFSPAPPAVNTTANFLKGAATSPMIRMQRKDCIMEETQNKPSSHTSNRGFASMDVDKQREIARKGGRAAHEKKTAHQFTSEEAREAGRKGGQQVSRDRSHMAQIGRLGGKSSAARRPASSPTGADKRETEQSSRQPGT
jgi:general stress protein YciG